MKKNILFGATLALLSFTAAPLVAQSSTTTASTSYVQSSSIIGSKIKDARGQDVGEIKDIVLDRSSGCLAYVVLSTHGSGATTTATRTVAAPWTVFSASSEPRVYMTRVEREKIYSAPVWESTRIEEYSRPEYITQVYGYYGVTPSFSVGVTSTSGTTTTGTTTTNTPASTNAAATPAATVTPATSATMTPAATASVGATMTPAAKASPSSSPANSPSKKSSATKSPAAESATSPSSKSSTSSEKKSSAEKSSAESTKSSSNKSEAKTEKSPRSESAAESTSESPSSKTKKPTEPETAPTPEG